MRYTALPDGAVNMRRQPQRQPRGLSPAIANRDKNRPRHDAPSGTAQPTPATAARMARHYVRWHGGGAVVNATAITPEVVAEHGLTEEDVRDLARHIMGREPEHMTGLGIFSVMWVGALLLQVLPRKWLKTLAANRRSLRVIQGPGENAGVIDIGGGRAAVFKIESHSHPSFHRTVTRARPPVLEVSCATSFRWARGPSRQPQRLALRFPGPPEDPPSGERRGRGNRRLWKLWRHADGGWRSKFPPGLQRQHAGQRDDREVWRMQTRCCLFGGGWPRQSRRLCRIEDRTRRNPWRHHGIGREFSEASGEKRPAVQGGRPVHRRAAACRPASSSRRPVRSSPIQDMGAAGIDLLFRGNGRQGRRRYRTRSRRGTRAWKRP